MNQQWHRWVPSSADDSECTRPGCGIAVTDDAMSLISIECPAPPCDSALNDGPCVYVRGDRAPECSYCERAGARDTGIDPDDDVDDLDAE